MYIYIYSSNIWTKKLILESSMSICGICLHNVEFQFEDLFYSVATDQDGDLFNFSNLKDTPQLEGEKVEGERLFALFNQKKF